MSKRTPMRFALIGATTRDKAAAIARRLEKAYPNHPIVGFGPEPIPGVETLPVSIRPPWGEWFRLVRYLRRCRFDVIVIPWCYDIGYRRFKIAGYLGGARHYIIFNEHMDRSHPTLAFIWRFLKARYREGRLISPQKRQLLLIPKALAFAGRFLVLLVMTAYLEGNRERGN